MILAKQNLALFPGPFRFQHFSCVKLNGLGGQVKATQPTCSLWVRVGGISAHSRVCQVLLYYYIYIHNYQYNIINLASSD